MRRSSWACLGRSQRPVVLVKANPVIQPQNVHDCSSLCRAVRRMGACSPPRAFGDTPHPVLTWMRDPSKANGLSATSFVIIPHSLKQTPIAFVRLFFVYDGRRTRNWTWSDAIRAHLQPILQSCDADAFQRTGVHSLDGSMTLLTLLERITAHIPHHIAFIEEKLQAMTG